MQANRELAYLNNSLRSNIIIYYTFILYTHGMQIYEYIDACLSQVYGVSAKTVYTL